MSRTKNQTIGSMVSTYDSVTCIIQSNSHKPIRLYVESFDAVSAAVKPIPRGYDKPLWFERDRMYADDEHLFQDLLTAFKEKRQQKLLELRSKARPWTPATQNYSTTR
jgi:hypothetical protein